MKKVLLAILLGIGAFLHSATASIIVDTATANTFAIDFEWGPGPQFTMAPMTGGYSNGNLFGSWIVASTFESPRNTVSFTVEEYAFPGDTVAKWLLGPTAPGFPNLGSGVTFDLGPGRAFVSPVVKGAIPTSITPTADGLGAHIVYGLLPDTGGAVPESGSNLAMLGMAVLGCVALRKSSLRATRPGQPLR